MKTKRYKVDVTDPDNVFLHKGGARKGHRYVVFTTEEYTRTEAIVMRLRPSAMPNAYLILGK